MIALTYTFESPPQPPPPQDTDRLTVAEEQVLSGLALASRVQRALYRLPETTIAELIERLREGARERHVIYLHDGQLDPIRILPCPIAILPSQLSYIHAVT